MEEIIPILKQYNELIGKIKKDFNEIYNSNGDLYSVANKSIGFLDEKIENLKQLKDKFSNKREKLEESTRTLEDEIRLGIGNVGNLKNNIVDINRSIIERYNEIEDQTHNIIEYFVFSTKKIKNQINKGEIKIAMSNLKEMSEVLKNEY